MAPCLRCGRDTGHRVMDEDGALYPLCPSCQDKVPRGAVLPPEETA